MLSAFHAEANFRQIRGGGSWVRNDHGIKVGGVVYARANEWSGWSAKVREKMSLAGARVVRPVLTTDARYTAAGWKANQYVPGQLRGRVDETAQMALRLDEAMSTVPLPNVGQRDDVFARAERAAWDETGRPILMLTSQNSGRYCARRCSRNHHLCGYKSACACRRRAIRGAPSSWLERRARHRRWPHRGRCG